MPETTNIFEVMSAMRAIRRLKPDPVPDELINKILRLPSGRRVAGIPSAGAFWWSRTSRSKNRCRSTTSAYTMRRSGHATRRARRHLAPTLPATRPAHCGQVSD